MNSYGSFLGGDPRNFHPDPECSTDEEREAHRQACAAWDRGERPEIQGHIMIRDPITGGLVMHIARNSFGLGTTIDEEENEPPEPWWDEDETEEDADEPDLGCAEDEELPLDELPQVGPEWISANLDDEPPTPQETAP